MNTSDLIKLCDYRRILLHQDNIVKMLKQTQAAETGMAIEMRLLVLPSARDFIENKF